MSGRHGRTAARARSAAAQPSAAAPAPGPSTVAPADAAIFREEALVSHAGGGQDSDAEIRLGGSWLRWLYWLAIGLVAAGTALALTATTVQESHGTAAVTRPGGEFAALLPVAVVHDVEQARGLTVMLHGTGPRPLRVVATRVRLATPGPVLQAGLPEPAEPSILLTGRLAPGAVLPPPGSGEPLVMPMTLVLRSEPVGAIVIHEFEVMIGMQRAGS